MVVTGNEIACYNLFILMKQRTLWK